MQNKGFPWLVALDPAGGDGGADALAARLRGSNPPIIARVAEGQVVLDPRPVLPGEDAALVREARKGTEQV
ncbi:MAG: hypothetical protein HY680_07750 [Chloroflexi bacterium]|nr:hypothetical protein [Chloroflexota bacterium]